MTGTENLMMAATLARGETVLKITPADAAFHNQTVEQLSTQAMGAIKAAFFAEGVKRAY